MNMMRTPDESRSRTMRAVRSKDTIPEVMVRRALTALGYRYRLHRSDLPGKPDIAFVRRRKAIFIHGCFWHGHGCARGARVPKTNTNYWLKKIGRNRSRDASNQVALETLGWSTLVLWECELRNLESVRRTLLEFLGDRR